MFKLLARFFKALGFFSTKESSAPQDNIDDSSSDGSDGSTIEVRFSRTNTISVDNEGIPAPESEYVSMSGLMQEFMKHQST